MPLRKWTIDLIRIEVEKKGYKLVSTTYVRYKDKLDMICPKGIPCKISTYDILRNRGCSHSECKKGRLQQTCLVRYGVDNPSKIEQVKAKKTQTLLQNYGVTHIAHSKLIREKAAATLKRNYGVESPLQNKEIMARRAATLQQNHGVTEVMHSEVLKAKASATLKRNYGVESPFHSEIIKAKAAATLKRNYGVESPLQNKEIMAKSIATCQRKYGVNHTSQDPEILHKIQSSGLRRKEYIFPSGRKEFVQGYEPLALDYLLANGLAETDILVGAKNVPRIPYVNFKEKSAFYYPDMHIRDTTKLIEVKSEWTYMREKDNNHRKFEAALKLGYTMCLYIFNSKGVLVKSYELTSQSGLTPLETDPVVLTRGHTNSQESSETSGESTDGIEEDGEDGEEMERRMERMERRMERMERRMERMERRMEKRRMERRMIIKVTHNKISHTVIF